MLRWLRCRPPVRAAGATAYVTPSPVYHTGRTGPCVIPDAAGVAEVHYLFADPARREGGEASAFRGCDRERPIQPFHLGAPFQR